MNNNGPEATMGALSPELRSLSKIGASGTRDNRGIISFRDELF